MLASVLTSPRRRSVGSLLRARIASRIPHPYGAAVARPAITRLSPGPGARSVSSDPASSGKPDCRPRTTNPNSPDIPYIGQSLVLRAAAARAGHRRDRGPPKPPHTHPSTHHCITAQRHPRPKTPRHQDTKTPPNPPNPTNMPGPAAAPATAGTRPSQEAPATTGTPGVRRRHAPVAGTPAPTAGSASPRRTAPVAGT